MNEPLCSSVGNSLEILKVVNLLKGEDKEDKLLEVVRVLGGNILSSVGLVSNFRQGYDCITKNLENGQAAEIFERMVSSLGGAANFLKKADSLLSKAPLVEDIYSFSEGYVNSIDSRSIGMGLLTLGGGRQKSNDIIDYSVGFESLLGIHDWVDSNTPLARIHARDANTLELAKSMILGAYHIDQKKLGKKPPTIVEKIG